MATHRLSFSILGVNVAVHCESPDLRTLLEVHWCQMIGNSGDADLIYTIHRETGSSMITVERSGQPTIQAADDGEFLYELEADVCIAVQLRRRDLYFVHAAVAEFAEGAHLLVADSGGGKSTTLWGMLHHGWSYMSDELAPIDLSTMTVNAYPRALCLKRRPPEAYPLPEGTLETSRTLHVPVSRMPRSSSRTSCPLVAAYFVNYSPVAESPSLSPVSTAEAAARLYAGGLNLLAHDNAGLDAAVQVAEAIDNYALNSADLADTCRLVVTHLAKNGS